MGQNLRTFPLSALAVVSALLAAGCPEKSPEMQIAEQRAKYTVKLNSFIPKTPQEGASEFAAAVAAEAVAEEAAAEGEGAEEEMAEPEGPASTTVLFDLLVNYDGREAPLPGITLDITHADPFEKEKGAYRYWIETADMVRGQMKQFSFEYEVPNFETGDVFSVELRSYVPPEELGDYREFAATAP